MLQAHARSNSAEPQRIENITIKDAEKHLKNATFQPLICREINGYALSTCKVLRILVEPAARNNLIID